MSQDISIVRYTMLPPKGDGMARQSLEFTWGRRSKYVTGVLRLVQMVVKLILTTPGSDSAYPTAGTIIPSLVKRGVTQDSVQLVKMDIMMALQDLERQIQDIQAALPLNDDERLKQIDIQTVNYTPASAEWQINIAVLSQAGQGVSFDISPYLTGQ